MAWAMKGEAFQALRRETLAGVSGRVLELGFGAGLCLPHYPEGVTELLALEPATLNRRLAAKRVAASPFPVSWVGLRGEQIPLDAASVDFVTSAWTLCTIPDLPQALREVRRVLRPGGQLVFIEHGLAPDPKVARWQHRLNGLQKVWAGGCHLNRDFAAILGAAGYAIDRLDHPPLDGPRFATYLYRGAARPGPAA